MTLVDAYDKIDIPEVKPHVTRIEIYEGDTGGVWLAHNDPDSGVSNSPQCGTERLRKKARQMRA
ncbi:MAG: hypothetical protein V1721_10565 [Pseudomonadota bacterium]